MPLYKKIISKDSDLALWRIEEDTPFFESKFSSHPDIKNEDKKLQWFATRHLVNEIAGINSVIEKDENGKPFLKNSLQHISISHTPVFAGAMLSENCPVGIDLEMVNPKVERIAPKFLRPEEIESIKPDEKTEKLILYWSAKEALYKLYGKRNIEFMSQLLIEPFELQLKGELVADIVGIEEPVRNLKINYEFFEDHVLSWVTNTK